MPAVQQEVTKVIRTGKKNPKGSIQYLLRHFGEWPADQYCRQQSYSAGGMAKDNKRDITNMKAYNLNVKKNPAFQYQSTFTRNILWQTFMSNIAGHLMPAVYLRHFSRVHLPSTCQLESAQSFSVSAPWAKRESLGSGAHYIQVRDSHKHPRTC